MPIELAQIIKDSQILEKDQKKRLQIQQKIKRIDQILGRLTKREAFLLSKSTIYRGLLIHRPLTNSIESYEDPSVIPLLKNFIGQFDSQTIKWIFQVILADYKNIFSSPHFDRYKKYTLLPNIRADIEILKIKRQLEIIGSWASFLIQSSMPQIIDFVQETILKLLEQFIFEGDTFLKYTNIHHESNGKTEEKFKFFTAKMITINENKKKKTKNLDDILNPIIKNEKPKHLPSPINDWSLNKSNYKAPKTLPTPVDDWILENDF